MKKAFKTLGLIAVTSLLMNSCSKEYNATPNEARNPFVGEFTAKLWGTETYKADVKYVLDTIINDTRSITFTSKQFMSYADTNQYRTLTISILGFSQPDTYRISMYSTSNTLVLAYDSTSINNYNQENNDLEGFVVISKADLNKSYEAYFQFNAVNIYSNEDVVPVTEGKIKLDW